jgi:hypothetical protein
VPMRVLEKCAVAGLGGRRSAAVKGVGRGTGQPFAVRASIFWGGKRSQLR